MRISDWSSDVCTSDLRKGRAKLAFGIVRDWPAHDMGPDREAIVGDVAQRAVELFVPVVEMDLVGCLECKAFELEHHHEVAHVERNDIVVDMTRIGEIACGVGLVLEDRKSTRLNYSP